MQTTAITGLIAAMPKVELHVHLEGCLEPEMALQFARKNRVPFPYDSIEQVRAGREFTDLTTFLAAMTVNTQTLRAVEDHYELTKQYLQRVHDENVVHVEIALSPQGFKTRGLEIAPCIDAVASALREARDAFGMTGGIIAGCVRHRPPDEALEMLAELRACGDAILAVGLHGGELGNEPRLFERHFQFARAQGWHTVAHAGEEGPADYVAQSLDILGAERIDHGVRAGDDPVLLERLAAEGTPLTVCPVSNICLGVFAALEDHNIARLLRRGVAVSLHSDDPAYFGGYLSHCIEQTAAVLDLSAAELVEMNKNAIRAAFLDDAAKQRLLAASDAALAAPSPRPAYGRPDRRGCFVVPLLA
ncbi:MAG TPA: adenosine deaminase [Stellaceae bacterium]|nr:adenosine deaminase [Stellaceae bacterium]